jgi:hypothetical protein
MNSANATLLVYRFKDFWAKLRRLPGELRIHELPVSQQQTQKPDGNPQRELARSLTSTAA